VAKLSKRRRAINEKVEPGKIYQAEEAFGLLRELSSVKFSETVDVAVNLGIDPKKIGSSRPRCHYIAQWFG